MAALTTVLYHSVAASESDFEKGLDIVTYPERFEAQIDYLDRNYDIVDLDTVLSGRLPRRPLLITFDDCYASVIAAARQFLKPKGIASLFFVNPANVGRDKIALDNVIACCINRFGPVAVCEAVGCDTQLTHTAASLIAEVASTWSAAERLEHKAQLLKLMGVENAEDPSRAPLVAQEELMQCAELGIEIGNHTANHVHGRALRSEELHTEIVEARRRLEALTGTCVRSFSLPYGYEHDLTPAVLRAIRESGHEAIFLVHARSNWLRQASDVWYRVSLQNEKPSELMRKLTVMPLLRSAKHLVTG